MAPRRCCVQSCSIVQDDGVPMHRFPNPHKPEEIEKFRTWVLKIGGDIVGEADSFIHRNRRVCHRHFEACYIFPNERLTRSAIPTLQIPGSMRLSRAEVQRELLRPAAHVLPAEPSPSSTSVQTDMIHNEQVQVPMQLDGPTHQANTNETSISCSSVNTAILKDVPAAVNQNEAVIPQPGQSAASGSAKGKPPGAGRAPWNLLLNDLLLLPRPEGVHLCAYADDVTVVIEASSRADIERKAVVILKDISDWGTRNMLGLSPGRSLPMTTRTIMAEPTEKVESNSDARRRILNIAVSTVLLESGFDAADKASLETLTEILQCFLTEVGNSAKGYCELSGRVEPVLGDVFMALINMGISLQGLEQYAARPNRHVIQPPQQAPAPRTPAMLSAGSKAKPAPHIPFHLPPLPDPHAYIRTPTHKQPVTEYEAIREKAASQKRDIERALTKFLAKTSETHNLFNTEDNTVFPLIACKPTFPSYLACLLPTDQVFDFDELEYHFQVANRTEDMPAEKKDQSDNEGDNGGDDPNNSQSETQDNPAPSSPERSKT